MAIGPDMPFNIIHSSGTTGVPKGIVQPHPMRWLQIRRYGRYGFEPGCVTLVSTPLYANTTLVVLVPALAGGGTVVLMAEFDAGEFLRLAGLRFVGALPRNAIGKVMKRALRASWDSG
jgi:long-chain acyl-CoA synthetase